MRLRYATGCDKVVIVRTCRLRRMLSVRSMYFIWFRCAAGFEFLWLIHGFGPCQCPAFFIEFKTIQVLVSGTNRHLPTGIGV
ncbi:hypothetical protein BJX76DRAFT_333557 [Aspergillus varians]